jgi:hypothetical protein
MCSAIDTYCLPVGSLSAIFSKALISSLAASLYFSTFFIIFKAKTRSFLQHKLKINIVKSAGAADESEK